jgi:DNA polymerase V
MGRGGSRAGAGRPKGSGKHGEPTKAIRLPVSWIDRLEKLKESTVLEVNHPMLGRSTAVPLYMVSVSAGLPTAAEDYIEGKIDLSRHLIKNQATTFLVRVTGDSMIGAGIHAGDLLIVDRSLDPRDQKIVIAVLNGELTVKRLHYENQNLFLLPENPDYPAIAVEEGMEIQVWGVVTNVIHPL